MKIVGFLVGVVVLAMFAPALGVFPALILGTVIGAGVTFAFSSSGQTVSDAPPSTQSSAGDKPQLNLQEAETQFKLGQAFRLGAGVPQDKVQGFSWIQKAAGTGHAEAQNMLGFMYNRGEGVEQNSKEAFCWYQLAAEQGNLKGQTNLGLLLADPNSEFHDYEKAFVLLMKAAVGGIDLAQEKLGELYYRGQGVQQSFANASKWYRLAAAQGSQEADRMLTVMQMRGES